MNGLIADNDIQGQMNVLRHVLASDAWKEIWTTLGLSVRTFADSSLDASATDAEVWHACQREELVLITGNRNQRGPDSLEATI